MKLKSLIFLALSLGSIFSSGYAFGLGGKQDKATFQNVFDANTGKVFTYVDSQSGEIENATLELHFIKDPRKIPKPFQIIVTVKTDQKVLYSRLMTPEDITEDLLIYKVRRNNFSFSVLISRSGNIEVNFNDEHQNLVKAYREDNLGISQGLMWCQSQFLEAYAFGLRRR